MKIFILLLVYFITMSGVLLSQDSNQNSFLKRSSIETSPMTPLGDVYSLQYNYKIRPTSELILGLAYVNIAYDEVGNNSAPSMIVGYRKFLWRTLHIQYELWPGIDRFYESNEDENYTGFQVWNEFRIGYQFDFKIKSQSLYTSLQWPLGFYLHKGNKPESFVEYEKENRFFYDVPLLYVGMRF